MKYTVLFGLSLIFFSTQALAQQANITFSVDTNKNKSDTQAIGKITKQASKIAKTKCATKTKFYATSVTMNIGSLQDGTYTGNANYTGECRAKTRKKKKS